MPDEIDGNPQTGKRRGRAAAVDRTAGTPADGPGGRNPDPRSEGRLPADRRGRRAALAAGRREQPAARPARRPHAAGLVLLLRDRGRRGRADRGHLGPLPAARALRPAADHLQPGRPGAPPGAPPRPRRPAGHHGRRARAGPAGGGGPGGRPAADRLAPATPWAGMRPRGRPVPRARTVTTTGEAGGFALAAPIGGSAPGSRPAHARRRAARRGRLGRMDAPSQNPELRSFLESLHPGEPFSGAVAAIERFGVFVALYDGPGHPVFPGAGFITVPELSWRRIGAASEAVHRGQRVTCAFLRFDTWNLEARLSLRAMRPDPFQAFADRTPVGGRLRGQVTELVPFGAFVRVADGIEGLVHLTELARTPVPAPVEAVRVGTARARLWIARARLGAAPFPPRGTGANRRDQCGKWFAVWCHPTP